MGEAPAAYKVVLMKCWEDASLADRNDWSLPVATGRKDRGAAAEGNQGRQKYQGRLDPPQTEQQGAAAEAGPGQTQLPPTDNRHYTPTHVIFLSGGLWERWRRGRGYPEPAATLSQSPA